MRASTTAAAAAILLGIARGAAADDAVDDVRRGAAVAAAEGLRADRTDDRSPDIAWGRAEIDIGGGLHWDGGERQPSYGTIAPSFTLSAAPNDRTFLAARSRLSLTQPFGIDGSHYVEGLIGAGPLAKGEAGADIALSYGLQHASDPGPARGAVDVARGAFVDHGGVLTLRPRETVDERASIGVPLSYVHRSVDWSAPNGGGGFQTNGARAALDLATISGAGFCKSFVFLGAAWSETTFASVHAGPPIVPIQRYEILLPSADGGFFLSRNRQVTLELEASPSIVYQTRGPLKLTDKPYFSGRLAVTGYLRDRGAAQVALVADPTWSPDGARFVKHYRASATLWGERVLGTPLGGVLSWAADRVQPQSTGGVAITSNRMSGVAAAWFFLVPGVRVGADYEVQKGPRDIDPFDGRWDISHTVTGFVRVGESF